MNYCVHFSFRYKFSFKITGCKSRLFLKLNADVTIVGLETVKKTQISLLL